MKDSPPDVLMRHSLIMIVNAHQFQHEELLPDVPMNVSRACQAAATSFVAAARAGALNPGEVAEAEIAIRAVQDVLTGPAEPCMDILWFAGLMALAIREHDQGGVREATIDALEGLLACERCCPGDA